MLYNILFNFIPSSLHLFKDKPPMQSADHIEGSPL